MELSGEILDIFNQDAFSAVSLTEAINTLPFKPGRIGEMGLFTPRPIRTATALIEEKAGRLALLSTALRGEPGTVNKSTKRKMRSFAVPHIPYSDTVLAAALLGMRSFGTQNALQTVAAEVNERMGDMRQDHEVTHEYHRIGALQGVVLDADGATTLFNWFTEFGVSEQTVDMELGSGSTEVLGKILDAKVACEDALGATPISSYHAFCGLGFFKAFTQHEKVKDAFKYWENNVLRSDMRAAFPFGGVDWEVYRGTVSGVAFFPDDEARLFPIGVPGLFLHVMSPADYIETVGTQGQAVYAKQERMKFDKGIEIETQSNPLFMCTRPKALVRLYQTNSGS